MNGKPLALIIGMTGGIGGATGRALAARGFRIRALNRAATPRHADGVEWVPGDAMNADDVRRAAEGVDVIVHGVNPPHYRNWRTLALPMLANTIAAAKAVDATIVFPGTVYNYGPDVFPVVTEDSPQNPRTRKGAIRVEMEQALHAASRAGTRVLIVRAGDFFGPGARNNWFSEGLARDRSLGRVVYPGPHDVGHAWAYLPDMAEAIARLVERRAEFDTLESFHFAGHWLPRGVAMAQAICDVAAVPYSRIKPFPWLAVAALRPFVPVFNEMHEMRYLWREPLALDNTKLVGVLGVEPHTELRAAVRETLESLGQLEANGPLARPA
ncbi:MAG: NAD-dependent epimerase/dehydratase family protein [Pseudomonadota bacterium]